MDIYQKAGVSRDDVIAWAQTHYPAFINNEKVLLQLYLKQVKAVQVPMTAIMGIRGATQTVQDMQPNKYIILEGIMGPCIRESQYTGCPECYRKTDGNMCPKCGHVKPKEHTFASYIFGDNTGDVEASVGPRLVEEHGDLEGAVLKIAGKQRESGELMVSSIEKIETPEQLEAKQTQDSRTTEVAMLRELASKFPTLDQTSISIWAQTNNIKTPIEELCAMAGVKLATSPSVQVPNPAPALTPEPAAPAAPAVPVSDKEEEVFDMPPAPAPVAPKIAPKPASKLVNADPGEVKELQAMKPMFASIKVKDLKDWHKSKKLKTAFDDLIRAAGMKQKGDELVWE